MAAMLGKIMNRNALQCKEGFTGYGHAGAMSCKIMQDKVMQGKVMRGKVIQDQVIEDEFMHIRSLCG
jgi:hypothetical protein